MIPDVPISSSRTRFIASSPQCVRSLSVCHTERGEGERGRERGGWRIERRGEGGGGVT